MGRLFISKNNAWFSLGNTMFALNTLLMLMVVSRAAGAETLGEFGIAYAIAQLLYIIGLFGVNHYQMTDYEQKYSFGSYFLNKIFTSALILLICGIIIVSQSYSYTKSMYILLLTLYMMVNSFSEVYQSLFFRENRLDLCGYALFFRTFFSFTAFAVIMFSTENLVFSLLGINIVNIAATFFLSVLPARRFICKSGHVSRKDFSGLLLECLPIAISLFLMTFLINCSRYVIDYRGNDIMQGYFAVVFIPAQVINLFSAFIFKPQLNTYNNYIETNKLDLFFSLFSRQTLLITGLTVAGVCLGGLFGSFVLGLLFKIELIQYKAAIVFIIIGGGFLALSALLYYLLLILRVQQQILAMYLICSVFGIFISVFFIAHMEVLGAAVSFMFSYILLAAMLFFTMLRCVGRIKNA